MRGNIIGWIESNSAAEENRESGELSLYSEESDDFRNCHRYGHQI